MIAFRPMAAGLTPAANPRSLRASSRNRHQRKGLLILAVFVGIFLVSLFAVIMLQAILQGQRVQNQQRFELQSRFLLEAGIQRARAQLARNPDYPGERWLLDESLRHDISSAEWSPEPESSGADPSEFDFGAEIQIEVLRGPETNRETGVEAAGDMDEEDGMDSAVETESETESETRTESEAETGEENGTTVVMETKTVRVTVHHPVDSRDRIRASGQFTLAFSSPSENENQQPTSNVPSTIVE
jgi:hypothetical protein